MSHDREAKSVADASAAPGGAALPDLAYVGQLFTALDQLNSNIEATGANEAAIVDVEATTLVAASDVAVMSEERETMATESDNAPLTLPAQCLLRDAVEIKATLLQRAEHAELHIDVSAVERIDAAFLQVLLALVKQRRKSGKAALRYLGASDVVQEAARVLGLSAHLQLPEAVA